MNVIKIIKCESKYTYAVVKLRVKWAIYESKYNDNIKLSKLEDI